MSCNIILCSSLKWTRPPNNILDFFVGSGHLWMFCLLELNLQIPNSYISLIYTTILARLKEWSSWNRIVAFNQIWLELHSIINKIVRQTQYIKNYRKIRKCIRGKRIQANQILRYTDIIIIIIISILKKHI